MFMDGECLLAVGMCERGKFMGEWSWTANVYGRQIVMGGGCSWAGSFHGRRMFMDGEYL